MCWAGTCSISSQIHGRGAEALKALEFIVVQDQFMTPTAKFGDIVLPANTFMERNDIGPPWLGSPYYIYLNRAIEPLYDTKTDMEIIQLISQRLGLPEAPADITEDDMLKMIAKARGDISDYVAMKKDGYCKIRLEEPVVSFKEQIEDPENHPFPTLSGKIEIYCDHLAEMDNPLVPPIPKYIRHKESHDAPLAQKYPLQLLTTHYKTRSHSTFHNVPWLREVEPQSVWIHPMDAEARGIRNGDLADVFNDRGRIRIPARVTQRIMPGVVNVSQGAWYDPDNEGVDHGGCANVLTEDDHSPGGAWHLNSGLVQVERSTKN